MELVVDLGQSNSGDCKQVYRDAMGYIVLKTSWWTNCTCITREIQAPNGSIITIVFSSIDLSDDIIYEKIEVTFRYELLFVVNRT